MGSNRRCLHSSANYRYSCPTFWSRGFSQYFPKMAVVDNKKEVFICNFPIFTIFNCISIVKTHGDDAKNLYPSSCLILYICINKYFSDTIILLIFRQCGIIILSDLPRVKRQVVIGCTPPPGCAGRRLWA